MCPGTASINKQGFFCVTVLFGGEAHPDFTNMIHASYFQTQEDCLLLLAGVLLCFKISSTTLLSGSHSQQSMQKAM